MALNFKILKAGALGTAATLYPGDSTVAGKDAVVKSVIITNKHATAAATVNLYVRQQADTTDYLISPKDGQVPAGSQLLLETEVGLLLDTGPDRIRGSSSGGDVQYVITGIERDIS